ncbi:hypothetical protein ES5_07801, partial [Dietzia cinnamea P4]
MVLEFAGQRRDPLLQSGDLGGDPGHLRLGGVATGGGVG